MEPFLGEIRMFAGNYAPQNWAFCNGNLLTVNDHAALYSLLGIAFGGNGTTNFALPDMRSRIPLHNGEQVSGQYPLGAAFGTEEVTLDQRQIPPHNHPMQASGDDATEVAPPNGLVAKAQQNFYLDFDSTNKVEFWPEAVQSTGGNLPHSNMMPFLAINFIICLNGNYPSRP